jgi:hypothetical protein
MHWDGVQWTTTPVGATWTPVGGQMQWSLVFGDGLADVSVVGLVTEPIVTGSTPRSSATGAVWNGVAWSQMPGLPRARLHEPFIATWSAGGGDRWLLTPGVLTLHRTTPGGDWLPSPTATTGLNAIWGHGAGDIWAVGDYGTVIRRR